MGSNVARHLPIMLAFFWPNLALRAFFNTFSQKRIANIILHFLPILYSFLSSKAKMCLFLAFKHF